MVGFSRIQTYATLERMYPNLKWRGGWKPTEDEGVCHNLRKTATVTLETLPADKWNVIWGRLSYDSVRAFRKFLQTKEKSLYPFFMYFFEAFLILGGSVVRAAAVQSGPSAESPSSTPEKAKQSSGKKPSQPPAEELESGQGSEHRPETLMGSDPASLKLQHEEYLRRNDIGGPCEFLIRRGDVYIMSIEAKQDIFLKFEANVCQIAAQLYTMAGANFDKEDGPEKLFGVLTDLNQWLLFELEISKIAAGESVKAVLSYSPVLNCFIRHPYTNLRVYDTEDLKKLVGWLASSLTPGLAEKSAEDLDKQLQEYHEAMRREAQNLLTIGTLNDVTLTVSGQKRGREEENP